MMADIWSLVSFHLVLAFQWLQLAVTSAQINQQFHLPSLPPRLPQPSLTWESWKSSTLPWGPSCPLQCLPVSALAAQALPSPQPLSHFCPLPLPLPLPLLLLLCPAQEPGFSFGAPRATVSVQVSQLPQELLSLGSGPHLFCSVHTFLVGMCCLSTYLAFVMLSVHTQRLIGLHPATSRSYTETVHFNFYFYQDNFLTDAFWKLFSRLLRFFLFWINIALCSQILLVAENLRPM